MSENKFLKKFENKTNSELENIITNKESFVEQARVAAIQLLKEKNGKIEIIEQAENEIEISKNENFIYPDEFKKYESTLKKEHSFNWTPKFKEEFQTDLNKNVFIPIVVKAFEKLGWNIVYRNENSAEAKCQDDWDNWTEKVSVTYERGRVTATSVSLRNSIWDNGKNSKRVRVFIYALKSIEKEFDKEALTKLEKEIERINNWDDYQIPKSLPRPKTNKKPQYLIPVLGGLIFSLLIGAIIAFFSIKVIYIIGVSEVVVAFLIGLTLKYLIKISNYTNYNKLYYLLIGMIINIYLSNQYFQYQIILNENGYYSMDFLKFIQLRLEAGLTIKSVNTGWIGLVISWLFQLGITYFIGTLKLVSNLTSYQLERVPMEVVDFAIYHFVKKKSESQIRMELSNMGWANKQDQDEVFESIEAINGATELNRI